MSVRLQRDGITVVTSAETAEELRKQGWVDVKTTKTTPAKSGK